MSRPANWSLISRRLIGVFFHSKGGAGEGEQKLKPDGSISNVQVVKTDTMIPSYCTPPNPCPLGYTSEDGCLEIFKNTASFSREYQSMQNCMCDSEVSDAAFGL